MGLNFKNYHQAVEQICKFLDRENATYKTYEHEAVRTSEEAAAMRPEYSLKQGAKALIVKVSPKEDGEKCFTQLVLPGNERFSTVKTKDALNARDVCFASEDEVGTVTDGILPGGVPPFGNLFGLMVYADKKLFENEEIIFNAGDRRFSIGMLSSEYLRIVQPVVVDIIE